MTIQQYLESKNIEYKQRGEQLWVKCLFNGCDDDSRPSEYHLSFNADTSQYYCQKCSSKGNLKLLMQFYGDSVEYPRQTTSQTIEAITKKCHKKITPELKEYLINERGLSDWIIDDLEIGYGDFYGHKWITIPFRNNEGVQALKLRKLPWDESNPSKYIWYPSSTAGLFNGNMLLTDKSENALVCEGEFDAIMAMRQGLYMPVSGTAGAGTFKDEWLSYFEYVKTVWICYDNDKQGEEGAAKLITLFGELRPDITIMQIKLPTELGEKADLTDYFTKGEADPDKLFTAYAKHVGGDEPLDISDFDEMTIADLSKILDKTIKHDEANKCILFLGNLTAYTEADQLNIFLNGPSSSGKTYIATEIAKYFPAEDVEEYASASPTSFIHRKSKIDVTSGEPYVDCERKILLFLELPHHKLQANLRPFLSHDKKEIVYLNTDKNKQGGNITKESRIRGFSATVFCSASMRMDEQEATRAILLSPEVNEEKMKDGINLAAIKGADPAKYQQSIDSDPERQKLKKRVRAIKRLRVNSVIINNPEKVLEIFREITKKPKPRHQRDIAHLESLIKAVALLNAWYRKDNDGNVVANEKDIEQAVGLWKGVSASQELGIPPYAHTFYESFILPAFNDKNDNRNPDFTDITGSFGVTRLEVCKKHYELTGQMPNEDTLRKNILPTLEAAGMITQEKDPMNKKQYLIYPKYMTNEYSGNDKGEMINDIKNIFDH